MAGRTAPAVVAAGVGSSWLEGCASLQARALSSARESMPEGAVRVRSPRHSMASRRSLLLFRASSSHRCVSRMTDIVLTIIGSNSITLVNFTISFFDFHDDRSQYSLAILQQNPTQTPPRAPRRGLEPSGARRPPGDRLCPRARSVAGARPGRPPGEDGRTWTS